eukprot:5591639-Prorocentrum_lima.AAC.1
MDTQLSAAGASAISKEQCRNLVEIMGWICTTYILTSSLSHFSQNVPIGRFSQDEQPNSRKMQSKA